MSNILQVLFADDQAAKIAKGQFLKQLENEGIEIETETQAMRVPGRLRQRQFDALLLDMMFDQPTKQPWQGEDVLEEVKKEWPALPVIIFTQVDKASDLHRLKDMGAFDYLWKDAPMDRIAWTIHRAVEHARLEEQVLLLREQMGRELETELAGSSNAIETIRQSIARAATVDSNVLILGESGTGKELVARAIHQNSARRDKPFIPRNCAALTETLLESELFGHVKGSFTGADRDKKGDFELAEGGTIFLDEIGEAAPKVQADLLRVLQERVIRPVGGTSDRSIDVRVIAATNRELDREVRERRFREDLYYRLKVLEIRVPPLRDRLSDLEALSETLLRNIRERQRLAVEGISREALARLRRYDWPGNVRELENSLERAAVNASFESRKTIESSDLLFGSEAAAASALLGEIDSASDALLEGGKTLDEVLDGVRSRILGELLVRLMERIRERTHRTPTQEELATLLGMKRTALAQLISRSDLPKYSELRRMADG